MRCKQIGKEVVYVGESARTGERRGGNHSREEHGEELQPVDWKMKVLRRYKTPVQRQIAEALRIEKKSITAEELLNKKGEWNGMKLPRMRLESLENEKKDVEEIQDKQYLKKGKEETKKKLRENWKEKD